MIITILLGFDKAVIDNNLIRYLIGDIAVFLVFDSVISAKVCDISNGAWAWPGVSRNPERTQCEQTSFRL